MNRRSLSSYGGFGEGIIIRGMPLLALYPGDVYWVDSGGGGGNKGTYKHPCLTLEAAHSLVTTDNGDIIAIKPGHAETLATTLDFSKSGFAIIGLGFGFNRPTFTEGISGTDDTFDFAGDDVLVYNLYLKEAAAGTANTWFNVSGDNIAVVGCYIELGAKSVQVLTHDTTAKKHLIFAGNYVYATAASPDGIVTTEKMHDGMIFEDNIIVCGDAAGLDNDAIIHTSGVAGNHLIRNNVFMGLADGKGILLQTDAQADSLCYGNYIVGDDATDHLTLTPASGYGFIWNWVTEQGKGVPSGLASVSAGLPGISPLDCTPAV